MLEMESGGGERSPCTRIISHVSATQFVQFVVDGFRFGAALAPDHEDELREPAL